jgi:hypothetical protein
LESNVVIDFGYWKFKATDLFFLILSCHKLREGVSQVSAYTDEYERSVDMVEALENVEHDQVVSLEQHLEAPEGDGNHQHDKECSEESWSFGEFLLEEILEESADDKESQKTQRDEELGDSQNTPRLKQQVKFGRAERIVVPHHLDEDGNRSMIQVDQDRSRQEKKDENCTDPSVDRLEEQVKDESGNQCEADEQVTCVENSVDDVTADITERPSSIPVGRREEDLSDADDDVSQRQKHQNDIWSSNFHLRQDEKEQKIHQDSDGVENQLNDDFLRLRPINSNHRINLRTKKHSSTPSIPNFTSNAPS